MMSAADRPRRVRHRLIAAITTEQARTQSSLRTGAPAKMSSDTASAMSSPTAKIAVVRHSSEE